MAEDRKNCIDQLGELGIVHVVDVKNPSSAELEQLQQKRDRTNKVYNILSAQTKGASKSKNELASKDVDTTIYTILKLVTANNKCTESITHYKRVIEQLEPWGSFSKEDIVSLEQHGYQVILSSGVKGKLPELPKEALYKEISSQGKIVFFAIIAPKEITIDIQPVQLPETTNIAQLKSKIADLNGEVSRNKSTINSYANSLNAILERQYQLEKQIEFVRSREGMGTDKRLAYLQGYVPEKFMDKLQDSSKKYGWAIQYQDADSENPKVPTLLKVPKIFQISKPIFDFIGISPSYNENDVSISVLLFLTLFFGLIIGDAGYGLLFLAIAGIVKLKKPEAGKSLAMKLFIFMSLVTVGWGWMTGNFFAISSEHLPSFMHGFAKLSDIKSVTVQKNIQFFCFFIAGVHLSMARIWQATTNKGIRKKLGHIGWAMFLWGNFFTAVKLIVFADKAFPKLAIALYLIGFILILTCGVDWKNIGDVLNIPFDFIGSFVDVLSYIRLFAVGLSSYYIAESFNGMGKQVYDISPWLAVVATLVIVFGHLLNIALGFMGVLVHGIRLNTLEFSNHMGLSWSGKKFKPLETIKTIK